MLWAVIGIPKDFATAHLFLGDFANLRLIPWMKFRMPERQAISYAQHTHVNKSKLEKEFREVPITAIGLLYVTDAHCRWPVGNVSGLSCGAAASGRYCAYHTGISDNQNAKKSPAGYGQGFKTYHKSKSSLI